MKTKNNTKFIASFLLTLFMCIVGLNVQTFADDALPAEYSVQQNDSLYKIAKSQLGDGNRWAEILELNRETIKNPSLIYVGQILKLPGGNNTVALDMPAPVSSETNALDTTEPAQQTELTEQQEADIYAQQLYDKASKNEPQISALLKSMESYKAHLVGFENRLKSVESTSRKILLDAHDMEISVEEASKHIRDSLRYTYTIEDSDYVSTVKFISDALIASGYTYISFKNYWKNKTTDYQGINTFLQDKDGLIFELQFHTPSSFDTKEEKTHKYYEIIRSETASEAEKEEATKKQAELFALVPVPEGVESLEY